MIEHEIRKVCEEIKNKFKTQKIIIYSKKNDLMGHISSFKICAVIDTPNILQCESEIYGSVDSDLPFDVLIYTPEQWEKYSVQKDSFASKIAHTGVIVDG